jgi:hypothetical protein
MFKGSVSLEMEFNELFGVSQYSVQVVFCPMKVSVSEMCGQNIFLKITVYSSWVVYRS